MVRDEGLAADCCHSLDFRPVFSGTLVGLQVPEVPPQAHMSKRENVGRGLWAA